MSHVIFDDKPNVRLILKGITCDHRRMRYAFCECCKGVAKTPCRVECPDCGLQWMLNEGIYG